MAAQIQTYPSVTNTELTPAPSAGFDATGIPDVAVFAGPTARGPLTPRLFNCTDTTGIVSTYGTGPTVKEALYACQRVPGAQITMLRLTTATVAASHSVLVITSATLSGFGTLSGTATDGALVLITCTTGGTTGTSYSYSLSLDGGVTTGAPVSVTTALTIVVLGTTLTLTTAKVISAGDTLSWTQTPASSAILPISLTGTGTALASATLTGTPLDAYEFAFKVINGGAVGTAGITYQISLDYGAPVPTWTATTALSTALTVVIVDGPISTEATGMTLTLVTSSTLIAGDIIAANTTAPQYDAAGVTAGLAALRLANVLWTWVRFVGFASETLGATVGALVDAWGGTSKPSWGMVDCRDRLTHETLAEWSAAVDAEWTPYFSTRVGYTKGCARVTDPATGRNNRRSSMVTDTPRAMAYPIYVDWGEFDLGPLGSDVTITDINGTTVEYNSEADPGGVQQGANAIRTWAGNPGLYSAGAVLPGPAGNIQRIPVRRVFNVGEIVFFRTMQDQILKNFRVAKTGAKAPEVPGQLFKADQAKINRIGNAALQAALVNSGLATDASFAVNPTPISLGGDSYQLNAAFTLNAFIYAVKWVGTSQLV